MSKTSCGKRPRYSLRLEMVGRDEALRPAAGRRERRRLGIVPPVGQELERQERVGRSALPEVQLDRVGRPGRAVPDDDEVEGEAPQDPLADQLLPHLHRVPRDDRGVRRVRGEAAAEIALPAGPAQHLVVRGQHLELAEGSDAELDARAPDLLADDALLDDPRELGQLAPCTCRSSGARSRTSSPGAARRARARSALSPGAGRSERFTTALPAPETPSLCLTIAERTAGRATRRRARASRTSVGGPEVLRADRIRHARAAEQLPAPALGPELEVPGIGAVHGDAQPDGQVPLELGRVVGHEMRAVLVRDEVADLGRGAAAAPEASGTAAGACCRAAPG